MNKSRIFPKSLKQRSQISKRVNLHNFFSISLDICINHLKTYPTHGYKCQQAKKTLLFFVPSSIFTFSYTNDVQ